MEVIWKTKYSVIRHGKSYRITLVTDIWSSLYKWHTDKSWYLSLEPWLWKNFPIYKIGKIYLQKNEKSTQTKTKIPWKVPCFLWSALACICSDNIFGSEVPSFLNIVLFNTIGPISLDFVHFNREISQIIQYSREMWFCWANKDNRIRLLYYILILHCKTWKHFAIKCLVCSLFMRLWIFRGDMFF